MDVYAIGTEVRLSGGPILLIVDMDVPNRSVLCAWRGNDGAVREQWIPVGLLDVVSQPEN
jgi:hypothetical protein